MGGRRSEEEENSHQGNAYKDGGILKPPKKR